ncbi:MAG: SEL1-like repeat protein [Rhodospirillales bacterium]
MGKTKTVIIAAAAVGFGAFAWPVQGYFQVHSFYDASKKYRELFHETVWLQDTRADERRRGITKRSIATNTAVKYPYPEKEFVMTEQRWRESYEAVEFGNPEWHHIEVVRQMAETEEYAPAMDFLGWMYEEGQGLQRDFRKAYMWYERAKLAGKEDPRGSTAKIFQRMDERDQFFAQLQLAEDVERTRQRPTTKKKPFPRSEKEVFERVKVRVFEEQRETEMLRKKLEREKRLKAEKER